MPLIIEATEEDKDLQESLDANQRTHSSALKGASALSQARINSQLVDINIDADNEVAKRSNANSVARGAEISGFM